MSTHGNNLFAATNRRPSFLLWGWLMLLVVLMSAAPTGGQPRTRLVGSAFDPATMSVALNAKQPKAKTAVRTLAKRDQPDDLTGGSNAVIGPSTVHESPVADASPTVATRWAQSDFIREARSLTRAHGARAPPTT